MIHAKTENFNRKSTNSISQVLAFTEDEKKEYKDTQIILVNVIQFG